MAVGLQLAIHAQAKSAAVPPVDWGRPGHAHLVGIGGSGMRALARVLGERGWRLSGSDTANEGLRSTLPIGTVLFSGHDVAQLPDDTTLLIHSDAVDGNNPELVAAKERLIPTFTYFDVVAQLMRDAHGLAVAGTHGKSTTTALAAWILEKTGLDPTVFCGATTVGRCDGGRAGHSRLLLAEACEYRKNFLKLRPRHGVLLGVEPDHFDCYPTPADAESAYRQFVASVPSDGLLLAHADCPRTCRMVGDARCPVETFSVRGAADWTARRIDRRHGRCMFDLVYHGRVLCRIDLPLPGRHNLLNAMAAAALASHQGVPHGQIAAALTSFPGLCRRFENLGTWQGITMLADFAHHPTELTATLRTARRTYPDRRICVVFQPHQACRTARLLDEMADSLHNGLRGRTVRRPADRLWIAEIFRAREGLPSADEVTSADLAAPLRRRGSCVSRSHRIEDIANELHQHLRLGDVLLVIGAGNIGQLIDHHLFGSEKTTER